MTTAAQFLILIFAVLGAAGATNLILPDMRDRTLIQFLYGLLFIAGLELVRGRRN